jgi:hypothetical protein
MPACIAPLSRPRDSGRTAPIASASMATSCVEAATACASSKVRHHPKPPTGSIQMSGSSAAAISACIEMIQAR